MSNRRRQISEARPLRHEHEPSVPNGLELGPGHQDWSRRTRRLDDDLVVGCLAEQEKAPVAQDGYSRQWRMGEPLPLGRHGTSFQTKPLRTAEHLGDANRRAPELMTNLLRIDPHPLQTQQHDQRAQATVDGLTYFAGHFQVYSVMCGQAQMCARRAIALRTRS